MNPLTRKAIGVFVLGGISVLIFAELVVPWVIEQAYQGKSLGFLNAFITGQASHPVSFYLNEWAEVSWRLIWAYIIGGLLAVLLFDVLIRPTFYNRFVGDATPSALGAIRILVCSILFLNLAWEDIPSTILVPPELRQPTGIMQLFYLLPFFEDFVESGGALRVAVFLTEGLLLCGVIGWNTRLILPLAALGWFILGGIIRQSMWFFHQGLVSWYVLLALSFMPAGDGLSVDRMLKVVRGVMPVAQSASPSYGWARYVCWSIPAGAYVVAGLSKVLNGGMLWWQGSNLRSIIYEQTLNPNDFHFEFALMLKDAPDALLSMLALTALLGEIFYGAVLFWKWARILFPVTMFLMHAGIFLLQNILFFDLMLIQLVFVNWSWVRQVVTKWARSRWEATEILYDGHCPLCLRTVRVLSCLDLFARLEFTNFRHLDIGRYNRDHNLGLTLEDLDREMYVVFRSQPYIGFYGYRLLALRLPALWPLVPFLYLPGVTHCGVLVYRFIAHERLKLVRCDDSCALPVQDQKDVSDAAAIAGFSLFKATAMILVICTVFTGAIVTKLERYPITAFPMFSELYASGTGVAKYYKVWANESSGDIRQARLENAIGALAHNRYRERFQYCFHEELLGKCEKLFVALGEAYNKKVTPQERVVTYTVEGWKWDFIADPRSPTFGQMEYRTIVDLRSKSATILYPSSGIH